MDLIPLARLTSDGEDATDSTQPSQPVTESQTDHQTIKHIIDDVKYCHDNKLPIYKTYFYKTVLGGHVDTVKQVVENMENNKEALNWLLDKSEESGSRKNAQVESGWKLKTAHYGISTVTAMLCIILSPVFYMVHGVLSLLFRWKGSNLSELIELPLAFAAFSHSPEMIQFFLSKGVEMGRVDSKGNNVFHYIADLSITSYKSALKAFITITNNRPTEQNDHQENLSSLMYETRNSKGLTALEYVAQFGSPSLLTQMLNSEPRFSVMDGAVMLKSTLSAQSAGPPKSFWCCSSSSQDPDDQIKARDEQTPDQGEIQGLLKSPPAQDPEDQFKAHDQQTSDKGEKQEIHRSAPSAVASSSAQDPEDQIKSCNQQKRAAEGATREEFINVTMYESDSNIAQRSMLLRLIAGRNVSSFSVKDLSLFRKCPVIRKWIDLKVNQMKKYIICVYIMGFLVTLLFFGVLFLMHGNTNLKLQLSKEAMRAELQEYEARAQGTSNILTPSALRTVSETQVLNLQLRWISDNVQFNESLQKSIRSELHINLAESDIWNLNTTSQQLLVDLLLHRLDVGHAQVLQNLSQVMTSSMKELIQTYSDLAQRDISTHNVHKFEKMLYNFFREFEVSAVNASVLLSDIMSFETWRKIACPSTSNLPPEAFKLQTQLRPSPYFPDNICSWHSLQVMAQEACKPNTPVQVYDRLDKKLKTTASREKCIVAGIIFMAVIAVIYIMVDTYEHLRFFYMVVKSNNSVLEMVLSVCSTRVPGSYYRKQLNIITSYAVIFHMCARADIISSQVSSILLEKRTYYLLLFGLILRFIMHIHCMRLLPWIGHFIVTTFMMATNLIHFSTVLGIVIFIFSVIFHLLVVDEDCPVSKYDGYETLGKSMLSVFMLTFGHGDFDQYRMSSPVTVTYILFVVIASLLLLNLIIAIMSTTAADVMTAEGKATLEKIDWLYEALSVEYTVMAVTELVRSINARWPYILLEKSGYHVEKDKVFIKVFYCDKLDPEYEY